MIDNDFGRNNIPLNAFKNKTDYISFLLKREYVLCFPTNTKFENGKAICNNVSPNGIYVAILQVFRKDADAEKATLIEKVNSIIKNPQQYIQENKKDGIIISLLYYDQICRQIQ